MYGQTWRLSLSVLRRLSSVYRRLTAELTGLPGPGFGVHSSFGSQQALAYYYVYAAAMSNVVEGSGALQPGALMFPLTISVGVPCVTLCETCST